jgi:hypothetical protein
MCCSATFPPRGHFHGVSAGDAAIAVMRRKDGGWQCTLRFQSYLREGLNKATVRPNRPWRAWQLGPQTIGDAEPRESSVTGMKSHTDEVEVDRSRHPRPTIAQICDPAVIAVMVFFVFAHIRAHDSPR